MEWLYGMILFTLIVCAAAFVVGLWRGELWSSASPADGDWADVGDSLATAIAFDSTSYDHGHDHHAHDVGAHHGGDHHDT
jgi:hypothetical protein